MPSHPRQAWILPSPAGVSTGDDGVFRLEAAAIRV